MTYDKSHQENGRNITNNQTVKTQLSLLAVFCVPLLAMCCKDNGITPIDYVQPGRRDYAWTIDTISPSQFGPSMYPLQSIWGSAPTDVWAGGENVTPNYNLFHYDGNKWSASKIGANISPIFGFGPNNVWIGGNDGQIWHYDGLAWKKSFSYSPAAGFYACDIVDIWGPKADDCYASGVILGTSSDDSQRGFVLHFDGTTWKETYKADFYSQFGRIRKEDGVAYIDGLKIGYTQTDTVVFYQLSGTTLKEIYSNTYSKIVFGTLNDIGGKVYFVIARDIFRFVNGGFVKQFWFNEPNYGYQIYGRTEKDIFVRMEDGLAHYNGTDTKYLLSFSNSYTGIAQTPAIFEKEVFFILRDRSSAANMVLHGKLN